MSEARRGTGLVLGLAVFVAMVERAALAPVVPVVAADMGGSIGVVGHALTAYALCYAGFQLVWSTLSARRGRVRVLVVSTLLGVVAQVLTVLSVSPWQFVAARGLAGAAFAATFSAVLVYLGDTLPFERRAVATANLATTVAVGLAAGAFGAGVLADLWGWRSVFVLVALAAAVLLVPLRRLEEPGVRRRETLGRGLLALARQRQARTMYLVTLLEGTLLVGVYGYLAVALQAVGETASVAGAVTAAFGVTVVVASQAMKLVIGRLPAWVLMAVAGAAAVLAFVLVARRVTVLSVLLSASLCGAAWALGHTTLQAWMTEAVAQVRATGTALFSVVLYGGASLGASAGSWGAEHGAFEALFWAAAGAGVVFALAGTLGRRAFRPGG